MVVTDSTAGTPAQQMGQHLRHAREAAGLTVDAVAAQLRMLKSQVSALEAGDWSRLGASIFVRGHLRSYAHLLKIELNGLDEISATPPAPVIPMQHTARRKQIFGRLGTQMVYVVITVLIGVPVWMAAQRHLSAPDKAIAVALNVPEVRSAPLPKPLPERLPTPLPELLPTPLPEPLPTPLPEPLSERERTLYSESALPISTPSSTPSHPLTTVTASLLPPPSPQPFSADVILQLNKDSWTELYSPDGRSLEKGLLKAGEVRGFRHGQLGWAVIGNPDGVTLWIGGKAQDLSIWKHANVARFAVSSDGVIGPIPN